MNASLPAQDVTSQLVRLAMTAVLMVAAFALTAPAGGAEAVAAGALGAVLVLSLADAPLDRLATRVTRRVRSTPYDTIAEAAGRLAAVAPTLLSVPHIAEAVVRGVGADRVEVALAAGAGDGPENMVSAGSPSAGEEPSHCAEVRGHGEIRVFKTGGLTPHERRLVDDVAQSAVVALRNAATAAELERRVTELAATVAEIAESRRRIVIAEQRHREAMARRVTAALTPLFGRLRDQISCGDLDGAARIAETLIDTLRSVSGAVMTGAEPT